MNLKEARVQAQQSMSGVTNKSLCTFINNFVKNVVHHFDDDESQRICGSSSAKYEWCHNDAAAV